MPAVAHPLCMRKAPIQEDGSDDNAHQDASGMRPGVPKFLLMTEMYFEFHIALFLLNCMIHNVYGAKILRNSEFDDVFRDCYDMDVIIWVFFPDSKLFYLLYLLDV